MVVVKDTSILKKREKLACLLGIVQKKDNRSEQASGIHMESGQFACGFMILDNWIILQLFLQIHYIYDCTNLSPWDSCIKPVSVEKVALLLLGRINQGSLLIF